MPFCALCRSEYRADVRLCPDCEAPLVSSLEDAPEPGRPDRLVTVAAYGTPTEASIVASRLEAAGIETFLADAETIAAHGLLAPAIGGVKVQVRESDARRAADVLRVRFAEQRPATPPCPECGSSETGAEKLTVFAGIVSVLLLGLPLLFGRPRWNCRACGRKWS